jgi:YfiH family protein
MSLPLLEPDWELPSSVRAVYSYGYNQQSSDAYGAFNLATHVGDDVAAVEENRQRLQRRLGIREPLWLQQVHGTEVAEVGRSVPGVRADAVVSRQAGHPAAILTADCLPVLFYCPGSAPVVAAAHAGWRGLCAGVLEQTLLAMAVNVADVQCWLGPAIGPSAFEVGEEVRQAFVSRDAAAQSAFIECGQGKYLADIYELARLRLRAAGVQQIVGGDLCTVSDRRFYSYRRAGSSPAGQANPCGRQISMIWLSDD